VSLPDNITETLKDLLSGLSPNSAANPKNRDCKKSCGSNGTGSSCGTNGDPCTSGTGGSTGPNGSNTGNGGINPSQVLIISAMLAGVLEVTSVLVDRNQTIEIVLTGSLKRKTELEKLLDQIGSKTLDEVVKAMLGRLGIP
jgi:hypothetical protein